MPLTPPGSLRSGRTSPGRATCLGALGHAAKLPTRTREAVASSGGTRRTAHGPLTTVSAVSGQRGPTWMVNAPGPERCGLGVAFTTASGAFDTWPGPSARGPCRPWPVAPALGRGGGRPRGRRRKRLRLGQRVVSLSDSSLRRSSGPGDAAGAAGRGLLGDGAPMGRVRPGRLPLRVDAGPPSPRQAQDEPVAMK
jgi:hypothetical protein